MDSLHSRVLHERRGYYFESYSELDSHETMISDYSRTLAYQQAIEMNSHLFEVRTVSAIVQSVVVLNRVVTRLVTRLNL